MEITLNLNPQTVNCTDDNGNSIVIPFTSLPTPELDAATKNLAAANEEISTMHQLNDNLTNDASDLNTQIAGLNTQLNAIVALIPATSEFYAPIQELLGKPASETPSTAANEAAAKV